MTILDTRPVDAPGCQSNADDDDYYCHENGRRAAALLAAASCAEEGDVDPCWQEEHGPKSAAEGPCTDADEAQTSGCNEDVEGHVADPCHDADDTVTSDCRDDAHGFPAALEGCGGMAALAPCNEQVDDDEGPQMALDDDACTSNIGTGDWCGDGGGPDARLDAPVDGDATLRARLHAWERDRCALHGAGDAACRLLPDALVLA